MSAQKTKIMYKGDVMAGSLYLLVGLFTLLGSVWAYYFTSRLGLFYLSIGLFTLMLYLIGKGLVMIYLYSSRSRYYKPHEELNLAEIKEERRYTRWRVLKKKRNRRAYIYTGVFACMIAFGGLFHQEKGLILATCIPIISMAAFEFFIGVLTEFRLKEYLKHLHTLSLEY